jgi:hypothetical protein
VVPAGGSRLEFNPVGATVPLTALHLARLGAYHGWPPDDVAEFLATRLRNVSEEEATRLAHEAHREHESVEEAERSRLDEEARQAEHDLRRRRSREPALDRTPATERAVADALEAATVFHGATGLSFEGLCDLIEGAFLLPRRAAALVAEEAIEQAARLDERTS